MVAESGWNAEVVKGVKSKECGQRSQNSNRAGRVCDAGSKADSGTMRRGDGQREGPGDGSRGP